MISLMRTIVDLPAEQIRALDEICEREAISRAEAVRRAVARYVAEESAGDADDAFGLWHGRSIDALAYEDELRGPREPEAAERPTHRSRR